MGKRLRLPPDDVADWHSVGIQFYTDADIYRLLPGTNKSHDVYQWLDNNTEGKYYTNSFARYMVVSFELETDALMFALRWTGGRIDS